MEWITGKRNHCQYGRVEKRIEERKLVVGQQECVGTTDVKTDLGRNDRPEDGMTDGEASGENPAELTF